MSEKLKNDCKFFYVHIERGDTEKSFKANGFSSKWDDDFQRVDFALFLTGIRKRLADGHDGAVVSFPTVYRLSAQKLAEVSKLGLTPVVLWGTQEHCLQARKERRMSKGLGSNSDDGLARYKKLNTPTFKAYGGPEYDNFREEVFQKDGAHRPDEELLARIMERGDG